MSSSHAREHSHGESDSEFLGWIMRYQDSTLTPDELQKLLEAVSRDPEKRRLFRQIQVRSAAIHDLLGMNAHVHLTPASVLKPPRSHSSGVGAYTAGKAVPPSRSVSRNRSMKRWAFWSGFVLLALIAALGIFVSTGGVSPPIAIQDPPSEPTDNDVNQQVILVEEVRARFFGQASLIAGATVEQRRDYLLQSGLVKLMFPSGATTILEAPAIFRVASNDRLILDAGACSVYAPPGAEGFEVITPLTKVVDRGTRFYVRVKDSNETEVHLVEGAADLYAITEPSLPEAVTTDWQAPVRQETEVSPLRLVDGEAVRLGGFIDEFGPKVKLQSASYRRQLPDRMVSYEASSTPEGTADELTSVSIQRGGQVYDYSIDELIPIEVTKFQSDLDLEPSGYLCGFRSTPIRVERGLEDGRLTTGLINFGGQPLPLALHFVVGPEPNTASDTTPGLGVRFRTPVVNDLGPDLVLFEVQSFLNPPEGDPFHVYPLVDRAGLKSHTVTKYDVTIDSPISRRIAPLVFHRFPFPIQSISDLNAVAASASATVSRNQFHVVAVAIDLSDLGFQVGEQVEGLFFQHAVTMDSEGKSKVDPVFIAGLPPIVPEK